MLFTKKELNYLLHMVRQRLADINVGFHRYFLMRSNRHLSKEETLPVMKEERNLLTRLRNKLWRMKRDDHDPGDPK